MQRSSTYVIGAGGAGVDVVNRLFRRRNSASPDRTGIRLLAVDSDGAKLDELPAGVPAVHLTSDSGPIGGFAATYPFVSADTAVTDDSADGRRDIGRYKFDNAASPEFDNYYEEVKTMLEDAFSDRRTSLSGSPDAGEYDVILVTSLGGGTGSGTLPLLATVVDHVGGLIGGLDVRIFGIGILPPLDFDPEWESPPADPYTYPNTYGALKNLSSLYDATDERPLRLPIYSSVKPEDIGTDEDIEKVVENQGTVFEITHCLFEEFWVLSSNRRRDRGPFSTGGMESSVSTVTSAIDVFERSETKIGGRPGSSSDETPSFGTLGYARVCVPHQKVRDYCQRKQELKRLRARRDRQRSRLASLRRERTRLASTFETPEENGTSDAMEWIDRVRHRLDCGSDDEIDFVCETSDLEFEDTLDRMSEELQTDSYLAMLSALEKTLTEGSIQQAIESEIKQTYRDVLGHYEADLVHDDTLQTGHLGDRLERLERRLEERANESRRKLDASKYGLRDIFPPKHDILTSRRERLEKETERLEADTDQVSKARTMFESFRSKRSEVEHRLAKTRGEIRSRLDELEAEITCVRTRKDETQDELSACKAELASYRQSLTESNPCGPEFVLPLERDVLTELTLDKLDDKFESLQAYWNRGLIDIESGRLLERLKKCVEHSRNWPPAITDHTPSKVVAPRREETYLLYDEPNRSLVSDVVTQLSVPSELWSSSHPEIGYSNRPFSIEAVSISRKGRPDSLQMYQRLSEQMHDGVFDTYPTYSDPRQAIAYPEWYDR